MSPYGSIVRTGVQFLELLLAEVRTSQCCSVASATRRCHTAPVNTCEGWRVVAWWRDGPAWKGCRAGPVRNAYRAARHAAIALNKL